MSGHELRFYGHADGYIGVSCDGCEWVTIVEAWHSLAELNRLAAQHDPRPAGHEEETQ